jgi:eukaryotic-like serine/threonine-protein kinase
MTQNFDDHPDLNEALAVYLEAAEAGTPLDREEWLARYPRLADELLAFLDDLQVVDQAVTPLRQAAQAGGGADALDRAWNVPVRSRPGQTAATIDEERPQHPDDSPVPSPARIAHFRIEQLLGKGGCGLVYLAWDEKLNRLVAIKVPHADLVARPGAADAYLKEARTVASLEHPNIVPVYQADGTDEFPCYIVSKYIDGSDLARLMARALLPLGEIARLIAIVAEALHYAHGEGVVHRDIKPGNILLDGKGTPFVTDFGLALREQDVGKGPRYLGTPVYMSPEQARGEGHRVDGRSDVFSLGVVLYELLTGRRPFHGASEDELLDQIITREVRPPRQWDDMLPRELERICLKALAKRASDRYTTAKDFADDLRQFLASAPLDPRLTAAARERNEAAAATPLPSPAPTPVDTRPLKVVPRGLRSFEAGDADFFLELVPGPRDREGLPESIRFWKSSIEETDAEKTFSVGLIYGPSGSGKSSLMKAGLLPRLADSVIPLYVEATADDTEVRVLSALRKRLPAFRESESSPHPLKDALTALRRGEHLPAGKMVLLVLDQFEQWLHGWKGDESAELLQALRQCEGARVQCLLLVRADFWVAVSTFLKALEVGDGGHVALVDRFDLDHARKVLTAFGRALGKLPENPRDMTRDQEQFLQQALKSLAEDNKVISVRLALFADMMKARTWTPATLAEMGGTEGVGVRFLEDTFSSPTANPLHRRHEKAARAVLQALLPDAATDIKGQRRPASELLAASGYANQPKEFDELLHILDRELHLLTPADAEENADDEPGGVSPRSSDRYFQLTHDYLVPDLRAWLTRKQKETRRGRAELLLAERAAVWNARPVNRQLPSLPEWLRIAFLTARKTWAPPQRKMMRRATRYHVSRWLTVAAVVTGLVWGSYEVHGRLQAHALYARLLDADEDKVSTVLADMEPYRPWLNPLLRASYQGLKQVPASDPDAARKRRRVGVAFLAVDPEPFDYLLSYLVQGDLRETAAIRAALAPHQKELRNRKQWLWSQLTQRPPAPSKQVLGVAAVLANVDANGKQWEEVGPLVAGGLLREPAVNLHAWIHTLQPVRERLRVPLTALYRDGNRSETDRVLARQLLAGFFGDQPDMLADLLLDSDPSQFRAVFPKVESCIAKMVPLLRATLDLPLSSTKLAPEKEQLARRQANAAVALFRLGDTEGLWPLLRSSPDLRLRSYVIDRLAPSRANPHTLLEPGLAITGGGSVSLQNDDIEQTTGEPMSSPGKNTINVSIQRALLLALGDFENDQLVAGFGPERLRRGDDKKFIALLHQLYREHPDPGLHSAAEWLTRQWEGHERVKKEDAKLQERRADRVHQIAQGLAKPASGHRPQWYVTGQGQTMVVIPAPGEVTLGWPGAKEAGMAPAHKTHLGYPFAIAAKSVTVEQFHGFWMAQKPSLKLVIDPQHAYWRDCPVHGVSWYQAAEYCNWLTRQEGLGEDQCCYLPNAKGEYADGMMLAPNFLKRTGYRLPTEDEWEFACRAGAATSRYYGDADELLEKYACFQKNSDSRHWPKDRPRRKDVEFGDQSWPVGSFKPNDLGLFDMHGNVWNWCQDGPRAAAPSAAEAKDDAGERTIRAADRRYLRGGSFRSPAGLLHCSRRSEHVPGDRAVIVGFRVARAFSAK